MFVLESIGDDGIAVPLRDVLPLGSQSDLVDSLRDFPAGTGLGVQLAGLDFPALTEAQLLAAARAWERQERWLAARRNELCAALRAAPGPAWDGRPAAAGPEEWDSLAQAARDRALGASIGLSPYAAVERVDAAAQLAPGGRLAATGRALACGQVPEASARMIATRLRDHDDDLAAAVEAVVLPRARQLTHQRLDRVVRREIDAHRAAAGMLEHEIARAQRRVGPPRPLDNGTASMQVVGPAEDIQVLHTAITALGEATQTAARAAARDHGDLDGAGNHAVENLGAHRFDALINLACAALADDQLPTHHGRRPHIAVTVPAAVLLGLSNAPADLEGHGPISAAAARRLAIDPTATWRRVLTDPAGRLVDYGTTTYRPPRRLTDLIIARDRTCTFPGCTRPARLSQIDHTVPFPAGTTSETNNDAKCGPDHNLKTAGLLTATRDPDTGTTTWTDRHGTTYTRPPELLPTAEQHNHILAAIAQTLADGRTAIADLRNRAHGAADASAPQPDSDCGDCATEPDDDPPY